MKYQTEYQRNFQKRTPKNVDDYPNEGRKRHEGPIKRSLSLSPSRNRGRSAPSSPNRNNNFAVIGPNDKFSNSHLYRLRQPVKDNSRVTKPREYAILGRNEKFQENTAYPLRKPAFNNSPRIPAQRQKNENHSCGIQTELRQAPYVSFDPQYGRETLPVRNRLGPQSEYQQQFEWKRPLGDIVSDQMLVEDSKVRDRRSDPILPLTVIDPSEKLLVEKPYVPVNGPFHVDNDVDSFKQPIHRVVPQPTIPVQSKKNQISEYQSRYRPIVDQKKPRTRKAFEAEQAEDRKRKELSKAEHAHTDDEGAGGNVNLGKEFQQKHPHGNLRRWKSEYQTTYKPFWRFDYKDGKWYKDATTEESGFNPNLFWYKELLSGRKRAGEYRANAEADHFNREHTLQLQTGQGAAKNYLAWDTNNDEDTDSVISIDHDLERERQRDRETKRRVDEQIQSKVHYLRNQSEIPSTLKTDRVVNTDHQVDRAVYIDQPIPKAPSAATKALVRNLDSSSVQHHMVWDSENLSTQRTNSDIDFKSNTGRDLHQKHYTNDESNVLRKASSNQQESRGTETHSPLVNERQQINNNYSSPPQEHERGTQQNDVVRPSTSFQERRHAAGRSSYDTHVLDKRQPTRPHSSMNDDRSYQGDRYVNNDNHQHDHTPASRNAFQNHLNRLDEHYGQTFNTRNRDDDVLSINSARSLSSSCSLASQTLERAQQNLSKYWSSHSTTSVDSPKKPYGAKH